MNLVPCKADPSIPSNHIQTYLQIHQGPLFHEFVRLSTNKQHQLPSSQSTNFPAYKRYFFQASNCLRSYVFIASMDEITFTYPILLSQCLGTRATWHRRTITTTTTHPLHPQAFRTATRHASNPTQATAQPRTHRFLCPRGDGGTHMFLRL